jgi:hypothetical protein
LAEKTYQHGHAIGRREAQDIGLNIKLPDADLEDLMWRLYECYEQLTDLREPLDPRTFIPAGQEEHTATLTMGAIESSVVAHHFTGEFKGRNTRQVPPQLALHVNLNLQLPANVDPQQLPAAAQQALQQMMQQFQQQAQVLLQQEIRNQMPVTGFQGWLQNGAWRQLDGWPEGA